MTTTEELPSTIPAVVHRAAARWPDDEAVVDRATRLTFAQLDDAARHAARAFVASGLEPGDRASVWAPNIHQWIVAALGLYSAGGVLVPLNTRFRGTEAAHVLRTSGARFLFTVTDFLDTDYVALLEDAGARDLVEEIVLLEGGAHDDTVAWSEFLARGDAAVDDLDAEVERREAAITGDSMSDIIFTSGTTGAPKGAMLRHGASVRAFAAWADVVGLRHGDRYLLVYPLFHTAGLKSGLVASLLTGTTLLPHLVFDTPSVMRAIQAERITMLPGPPAIYQTILNADLSEFDFSSLRLAVTGAAVVPVELVVQMREQLGIESVVTGYGLTETTGIVSMCRHDDDPEIIAHTSGRPIPGVEMKIVGPDGADLPTGEPGEILARGYQVMIGYFDNPAATAETIDADGWLHTGDVGYVDAANNVTITDRIKDMFIVGGFNAYPAEIEGLMLEHPDLAQVAIVGVPDARMGEVGMAFVVPRVGHEVDPDAVLAWSREHMANFKVPRYLEVVDALPLNASGKVLKFELRERAKEFIPR
ncbi:MAG: HIP---CoA ligase [Actinomycetota bacterium]|nr:HIP---CoA ligase [Actinomycetota bacterium]